jgi:hypothetical protein
VQKWLWMLTLAEWRNYGGFTIGRQAKNVTFGRGPQAPNKSPHGHTQPFVKLICSLQAHNC